MIPFFQNYNFCNYYSINEFCSKIPQKKQFFGIFHLNINSLQFHKNDLDVLLDSLNTKFDVITISETRLQKSIDPTKDINLSNYLIESTPTEAEKGGTLIYISKKYEHKLRKDLEIYESKKVESTFVEIANKKGKNVIVGCIYRHLTITNKEFSEKLTILLKKIKKEKKSCYLAGDFNVNLLDIEKDKDVEQYFDSLTNYNFMPLITSPTRISKTSKTLIDNIFYNQFTNEVISGNLTVGISDHMPQFALIPSSIAKMKLAPSKVKIRKYNQIETAKLNEDINNVNWSMPEEVNIDQYSENFLHTFNEILNIHAPETEITISKNDTRRKAKPWISKEIIKLIKSKDKT